MTPILLSGPAVEPVSLAEARSWLRVTDDAEDLLIAALVTSARLVVEAQSQCLMISQSWRLIMDRWPDSRVLLLPLRPFRALQAVRVFDAADTPAIIDPAIFALDPAPLSPRLFFASQPLAPGKAIAGIEMEVEVGFGPAPEDVPEPLRQAIRLLVARWFENRGDTATDARNMPDAISALLVPWRAARLA